jgi:RNA polymerase sigma-B factor
MAAATDPRQRHRLREQVITRQRPSAHALARRFGHRGEPLDDLYQVADIGLVKAVDGFDPDHGSSFWGFAVPTIQGELRRHFRDRAWMIRVPRRLKDLRIELAAAGEALTHELGRTPTTADLAARLGTTEEEVRQATAAGCAYAPTSLQAERGESGDARCLGEVELTDGGFDAVETRQALRDAVLSLPARERRILGLRFFDELTQAEIAGEVGLSQMQVSRLLHQSLGSLRSRLSPAHSSAA